MLMFKYLRLLGTIFGELATIPLYDVTIKFYMAIVTTSPNHNGMSSWVLFCDIVTSHDYVTVLLLGVPTFYITRTIYDQNDIIVM